MPQFDVLVISTQALNLLLSLAFLYYKNINLGLLCYVEIKKIRSKKIQKIDRYISKASFNLKLTEKSSIVNYQFYLQSNFI